MSVQNMEVQSGCDVRDCTLWDDQPNLLALNRGCNCLPLPRNAIDAQLIERNPRVDLAPLLAARSTLFAGTGVFVSPYELMLMQQQVHAIEALSQLPGYQDALAQRHPGAALRHQPQTRGLLMGYDFHLTQSGPRLIEVNTNAGGAFIMHALTDALTQMVAPCDAPVSPAPAEIETALVAMVREEWRRAGRSGSPTVVAIVDRQPAEQYLYPDMLLARDMLQRHGMQVVIADPTELQTSAMGLEYQGRSIDLVYNRLTDFALEEACNQPIRRALKKDQVVVSPAPRQHALLADKRNMVLWQDEARLLGWGLSAEHSAALTGVPDTQAVTASRADEFWQMRKQLFFKPSSGFGSRAAYRGSKLTRSAWQHIVQGGYVAQQLIPPAQRRVQTGAASELMKFDVRLYTYAGETLLAAARVYRGQTTNFRTPGGGFAPVVVPAG